MSSTSTSTSQGQEQQCTQLIEEGKKALALQEWEKAVEKYAGALEIKRTLHGELSPLLAPLLLSYGKAVFEVAVSQQGVMGKADDGAAAGAEGAESGSSEKIRFEGEGVDVEGEDEDDAEEGDDEEERGDGQGAEGEADEEPEDDFNEAWMVLDLARTMFESELKEGGADDEEKRKIIKSLGDCLMLLGDVSLETENFPQAVEDYKTSLQTFTSILPFESREIASAHFKLGVVLESVAEGRQEALENIEKAIESVEARRESVIDGSVVGGAEGKGKGKGKGKAEGNLKLDEEERKRQEKECDELLIDLKAKLEDLRSAPPQQDFIEQSIAHLMGTSTNAPTAPNQVAAKVNDLTSMVKKKGKSAQQKAQEAAKSVQSTTASTATDIQAVLKEKAEQALKSAQDLATSLIEDGSKQAQNGVNAIMSAAAGVYDGLLEEGREITESTVNDLTETVEDVKAQGEKRGGDALTTVSELATKGSELAQHAFHAAVEAGQDVAQAIIQEGQETSQEAVAAVAGVAADVMGAVENVAHEGKRKAEDLEELKVQEEENAKKQKTT